MTDDPEVLKKEPEEEKFGQDNDHNSEFKDTGEEHEEQGTYGLEVLDLDEKPKEIKPNLNVNPLFDFISVKGKWYAVRSIPMQKEIDGKMVLFWKTHYTSNGDEFYQMQNNKIEEFEVRFKFSPASMIAPPFLHRNTERQIKDYKDIKRVFFDLCEVLNARITMKSSDIKTLASWIMAAHFVRVFDNFPPFIYSKIGSDAGGSTALFASTLTPYPVLIFDPTEATLFRLADMGASLLMDELPDDILNRESKIKAVNIILDGSFTKDIPIPRATGKGYSIELFDTYGPKMLVDTYASIVKASTLSRSIRVRLERDPKRSELINPKDFVTENSPHIQDLYALFLPYANKVREEYLKIREFSGRQRQAYAPILAIAKMVGCYDDVKQTILDVVENLDMQRNEADPMKYILRALYDFLESEFKDDISLRMLNQGWYKSKDGVYLMMPIKSLRMHLMSNSLETYQTDESHSTGDGEGRKYKWDYQHNNKREWKSIPQEIAPYFTVPQRFNAIIKDALPNYIKEIRGTRFGLKVKTDQFENILKDLRERLRMVNEDHLDEKEMNKQDEERREAIHDYNDSVTASDKIEQEVQKYPESLRNSIRAMRESEAKEAKEKKDKSKAEKDDPFSDLGL